MPVQKKTSIYFAIEVQYLGEKFLSLAYVSEKSRTLHISLLNVNQSLKNPNLWQGLKLKIFDLKNEEGNQVINLVESPILTGFFAKRKSLIRILSHKVFDISLAFYGSDRYEDEKSYTGVGIILIRSHYLFVKPTKQLKERLGPH